MAAQVIKNGKLYIGGRNLSGDLNAIGLNHAAEMLDNTKLGSETRSKLGGLKSVALSANGFFNADTNDDYLFDSIAAAADNVTVCPVDGSAGDIAYMFKATRASYAPGGSIGELMAFSAEAEAAKTSLIRGTVLHTATAQTVSGSSTPQNLGAITSAQKLYANLHALAASAGDTLDVIIESDTTSGFTAPTTRATFSTVSAIGGEWITPVDGPITDTWWRISWTIAGTAPSYDFIAAMGIQ